ncbi:MAG: 50S ribosomal protein L24 [Candidatus Abawacabacteria bacterium RIFCSPHIGHO2_01_FULL_46_8]|uniref:Large ribosomal subunit protein uL24 n=1 Tax=Candidatus Abawacabacteria bacterium RIFCSPHIGHO2_01_FULL_46_8 TaxID=1817815 RepID=A0A1F4XMM8_9BACT|nr:ribosomal protein L24 [uncultured bacterium]OGC82941.1 MAG: 50S ribosomal protein L24 [Candidatus Abawacabacteria bacterium RIFCSPHIGHO2_01_FULL_46_8]
MKIKQDDKVLVISGKDRGKQGKVLRALPDKDLVVVEKVNLVKKHIKSREGVKGGIFSFEKGIHVSNVKLLCPQCDKATRVGAVIDKNGRKQRTCKLCQSTI